MSNKSDKNFVNRPNQFMSSYFINYQSVWQQKMLDACLKKISGAKNILRQI